MKTINKITKTKVEQMKQIRRNNICLLNNVKIQCNILKNDKRTTENHLIQRNNYLQRIAENDRVCYFDEEDYEYYTREKQLPSKHIKRANRYRVFCGNHDKDLFSEIENEKEFNEENKKQCFQFAMRAFLFDYSKCRLKDNINCSDDLFDKVSKVHKYYDDIILDKFRDAYISEEWDIVGSKVFKIPYQIKFISCTSFFPMFDLNNKYTGYVKEKMFINIFPNRCESVIILSYLKDDGKKCEELIRQIMKSLNSKQCDKLYRYLSKILVCQDKCITLNPVFWRKLSQNEKDSYIKYAYLFRKAYFPQFIKDLLFLRYNNPKFNLFM